MRVTRITSLILPTTREVRDYYHQQFTEEEIQAQLRWQVAERRCEPSRLALEPVLPLR